MEKTKQLYLNSLKELIPTKNIVLCGLMAALAIVLGTIASIEIGPYIKIGFSGIPNRIIEFLFGPVVGALFGAALDILKYIIKPNGPFFFGFTFNVMVSGIIYGTILYKHEVSLRRIVLAELLTKLFVNCLLNTLWISVLYGKTFMVLFPMRALKNAIMLPIDSAILFFTLTYVKKLMGKIRFFD